MKNIYVFILISLAFIGLAKAQDVSFSFANSAVSYDGMDSIFEVDVMIASSTADGAFTMSSGQLYFNYSEDAFGINANIAGKLGVLYDDAAYLLSLKDSQFGIISVYSPPITNDNTPNRFSVAWQQDRAGSCIGEQVTEVPRKLFRLQLKYVVNGTSSTNGLCFEDSPVYTDQVYTSCGPFTDCVSLPAADCTNSPGIQINSDFFSCTTVNACAISGISNATAIAASRCDNGSSSWLVYSNPLGEAIFSINPRGNNLGDVLADVSVRATPIVYDNTAYCGRSYKITPQIQPLNPVDVRIFLSSAELLDLQNEAKDTPPIKDNFNSIAELGIVKYQGPSEDDVLDLSDATSVEYINQNLNGVEFGANYIELTVNSFSEFWITSENSFLPLELVSFNGQLNGNVIDLDWITENEENTYQFIIQRSNDGIKFNEIGTVSAAGNSTNRLSYQFTDIDPLQGGNYYRLKMVDIDGSFSHSQIIYLITDEFQILNIFPNPVQDENNITINLISPFVDEVTIEIIDYLGRIVLTQPGNLTLGNSLIEVPSKKLIPGSYMVRIQNNTYKAVKKFVKIQH